MIYSDEEWAPVVGRIAELLDKHGSMVGVSRATGVHPTQLSLAYSGKKRYLGEANLKRLGLERVVIFRVQGKLS